ncbi:MAG: T9SS type A sorting domain-containing protein [Elusimicrobia bacterium]|nr:T9SS type A sorting domain-containing protein [Elusimicrobiota bacterium]
MSALLGLLLLLASGAPAQETLTGGDFELRQHSVGRGAESSDVGLGSFTLRSAGRAFAAARYPLGEDSGRELMPPPGWSLYSHLVNNRIDSPAGQDAITVGSFAAGQDFEFFFNPAPQTLAMRVDPERITQANALLGATAGPDAALVPNKIVELNLRLESGSFQESLARDVVLNMDYQDADSDGIVDATNPPIRARTLAIYTLDEARGAWVRVSGSSVDLANRRVRAAFPHLSVYALIGTADTDVDAVYAFPVPWAPNSGNPADGTLAGGITFTNLPSEGAIQVFTVSGQRVRTLAIPPFLFPPQLRWDGRTESGANVASGVYLWRIESGRNSKMGKLMIIR